MPLAMRFSLNLIIYIAPQITKAWSQTPLKSFQTMTCEVWGAMICGKTDYSYSSYFPYFFLFYFIFPSIYLTFILGKKKKKAFVWDS
jgi:hypothetical protein